MAKSLMQSVASQLQKERKRLEDELHRVTAAPGCFRESLSAREQIRWEEANHVGSRTQANRSCAEGALGKD